MAKYSFKFEGSVSELKCLLKGFPGYLNVRVSSVAEPELKAINPSSEHAYTSEDVAWERIKPLVLKGDKIRAIKELRELTGFTLKEANYVIEQRGIAAGYYMMGPEGHFVLKPELKEAK